MKGCDKMNAQTPQSLPCLSLRLKDSRWAGGVEACIRSSLRQFIVNDNRDLKTMQEVCRHENINQPEVVVFRHTRSPHVTPASPAGHFLISELVELDHEALAQWYPNFDADVVWATVFNCLVDWNNIDQCIVMDRNQRQNAEGVMFRCAFDACQVLIQAKFWLSFRLSLKNSLNLS